MSDDNFIQDPQQRPATSIDELPAKMSHIKGWAIDANPKNDPTYPMRQRFDGDRSGYNWSRPVPQRNTEGILKSNERPGMPAVFGTSAPAINLSGAIRRYAFQFSEGRYRHWLLLLLADRVNVVEGLVSDIFTGHVPHCLDERGLNAELKYNRKTVITRVAVGAVVITSLALLMASKKAKRLS
jgi:hypothetical protein